MASQGRKIVIAVDDSIPSKEAVAWAAKTLVGNKDEVHLISVIEAAGRPDVSSYQGDSTYLVQDGNCKPNPLLLEKRADLLKNFQSEVSKSAGTGNIKLTTLVSCIGGSADLGRHICEYSAENKADFVVMGSRGMGSAQRSLLGVFGLGSVSDFVSRHGNNVLIHHGEKPAK